MREEERTNDLAEGKKLCEEDASKKDLER